MEPKVELISLLRTAICAARHVVIFAIEQEAIGDVPIDIERAIQSRQVMRGAARLKFYL
jgi:hypothetical protein